MSTIHERLRQRAANESVLRHLSDADLAALSFVFELNPGWGDVYLFASGEIENGDDYRDFCSLGSRVLSTDRENTKLYPRGRSGALLYALSRGIPMNISRSGMKLYHEMSGRRFRCQM